MARTPTGEQRGPVVKCIHCPDDVTKRATHRACCDAHKKPLCCRHYRRAHFVEVGFCCEYHKLEHESAHAATAKAMARVETK